MPHVSNPESFREDSLDCFAALAMTDYEATTSFFQLAFQIADTPSHSRGSLRPSFASSPHPLVQEGAGKAGCRLAPTVRCALVAQKELHSGMQVKPNTRPSLRSGLTAYAVLSREPSSFWPPSPPRKSRTPRRLTRMPPPRKLDRSNDGQDHTVLPYARLTCSPHYLP